MELFLLLWVDRHAADAGSIPRCGKGFLSRVNFQCRLSFGVRTPPYVIACINICAHVKDSVVHVRVRWIMATQTYPARTSERQNNQLDDRGRSVKRRGRSCFVVKNQLHGWQKSEHRPKRTVSDSDHEKWARR